MTDDLPLLPERPPESHKGDFGLALVVGGSRGMSGAVAMAVNGVYEDGFQTTVSPHTAAIVLFHDQTAVGKLNEVINPSTPSGCHCSYIR